MKIPRLKKSRIPGICQNPVGQKTVKAQNLFQISIPIPRISEFFDLAQNKKLEIPKKSHPEANTLLTKKINFSSPSSLIHSQFCYRVKILTWPDK